MEKKWIITTAIVFGILIVAGTITGITLYLSNQKTEPHGEEDYVVLLAQELQSIIPEIDHLEILGNATSAIHERLIWAAIEQEGDSSAFTWNVTAFTLDFDENMTAIPGTTNFELNIDEINQISQGLFDAITNTTKVGTYGVAPYDYETMGYLANVLWGINIYLVNTTVIQLLILEDNLVFVTTWTGDINMGGADILEPVSAFEHLRAALETVFSPYLDV